MLQRSISVPVVQLEDIPRLNYEESTLKMQNSSLATRLDYLKKIIKEQRVVISDLLDRDIKYQKFFNCLEQVWRSFLQRNMRIQSIVKKRGQLETKYINAFQYLDDIFHHKHIFVNDREALQKKSVTHKFEQFLRIIENIYLETSSDYTSFIKVFQDKMEALILNEEADMNEYVRNLINTNKEIIQRNQEIEKVLKNQQKIKEKKINELDGQLAYNTVLQLQTMLTDQRKINEQLTRKLRLQQNNEYLNIEDEDFECICGGQNTQKSQSNQQYTEILKLSYPKEEQTLKNYTPISQQHTINTNHLQQLLQKALKNNKLKINQMEEENFTVQFSQNEIKELENILSSFYSLKQKNDSLTIQNKKYQNQLVLLETQYKELEIQAQYSEDRFVQSETFKNLKMHNINLVEQNQQLIQYIQQTTQQYEELTKSKSKEIFAIQNFYENEIKKLQQEINQLGDDHQIESHGYYRNTVPEIETFIANYRERNNQLEKIYFIQDVQAQDMRRRYDELSKERDDIYKKLQEYEQKLINSKLGDQFQFRHQKHEKASIEILELIQNHQPELTPKFQELMAYIKSRDSRLEHVDREVLKLKANENQQKKYQLSLLDDIEATTKTYEEILQKSKIVEDQLKQKEKNEATLIQEKIAEKSQFEIERSQMIQYRDAQSEYINRIVLQISDQQQLIQKLTQEKFIKQENTSALEKQLEDYKAQVQKLESELMELRVERDSLSKKQLQADLINQETLLDNDKQEAKILEMENQIKSYEQSLNDPSHLEQTKGYLIIRKTDQLNEQNILTKLKQTASCTDCKINLKEIMITRCLHILCRPCSEKALFNEKCPICQVNIMLSDLWQTRVQE
ncbi:hypothetical protein pb186bvf_010225 [Paramecium bursaria]